MWKMVEQIFSCLDRFREGPACVRPNSLVNATSLIAVAMFFLLTGCEPKPTRHVAVKSQATEASDTNDLVAAVDMISRWENLDEEAIAPDVLYHLNRWMESQSKLDWKPDPLLERLPRQLRQAINLKDIERQAFQPSDMMYLREAIWMREISKWVTRQPAPVTFTTWQAKLDPPLDREVAAQLASAVTLFDWTIRNVQLDPLLPYPADQPVGPTVPSATDKKPNPSETIAPPARGEPGPGYRHENWQIALVGHGDAWERARLFMALGRQQDLPIVMLGIEDPQSNRPATPWLPALLLDGQLYLFDTSLGMPLPSEGLESVVTLDQLISKPELLEKLSLSESKKYPISKTDLEHVVALVDAGPEAVSQRMQMVEAKLTAQYRLSLVVSPSGWAEKLRPVKAVTKVVPWGVPWETVLYWNALAFKGQVNRKPSVDLVELQLFAGGHPLAAARQRHLRGEFDKGEGEASAKSLYMDARIPTRLIENLANEKGLQQRMGLFRSPRDTDEMWARKVAMTQEFCMLAKTRASFWLGLVQYDSANYSAAADWFKERAVEGTPQGPWKNGARYNLARSYEQLGKFSAAREIYNADESPQMLGNALRAHWMTQRDQESK